MSDKQPNIQPGRLDKETVESNFSDLHPPLQSSEARIEAERCYFCFDAPCTTACPTGIDIPGFIQKISSNNLRGSALTILTENIMGGMCARVCPTEILCEDACVRNIPGDKPIEIGLLQRYATDPIFENNTPLFTRKAPTGKHVAVVGGGPAGPACAHRLAMLGHAVVVFNQDKKLGGLNEYGIAAYKTVNDFAQREVDWILSIEGIEVKTDMALGTNFTLNELSEEYDGIFLGIGLGSVNKLDIPGEDLPGVENAIDYIGKIRQSKDKTTIPVGKNVVVVGGGMTAIDIAVQSKHLGSSAVTIVYRRGPKQMGASTFEQKLAQTNGVSIRYWAQPLRLHGKNNVTGIEFETTTVDQNNSLSVSGDKFHLNADIVFKAIGQTLDNQKLGQELSNLATKRGKIIVDQTQATSIPSVWAGGDCVLGGDDLTVSAVQHGKIAATAIDRALGAPPNG